MGKLRTVYITAHDFSRMLVMYELYNQILDVHGSIVECGVGGGLNFVTLGMLHYMLEPFNLSRKLVGFDTFAGFPATSDKDLNIITRHNVGDQDYGDGSENITAFLKSIPIGQVDSDEEPFKLVVGDIVQTAPQYLKEHPHLLVSLLFLDCDLHDPTLVALETFKPRMPKGAIIVFDELNMAQFPGETLAMLETFDINSTALRRFPFAGQLAYYVIE